MSTSPKQTPEEQTPAKGYHSPDAEDQYTTGQDALVDSDDDRGNSEEDRRTGTSISGNTAHDSFNATAEEQQIDRDKNAEN